VSTFRVRKRPKPLSKRSARLLGALRRMHPAVWTLPVDDLAAYVGLSLTRLDPF
jgi:hypothetical protein